MKSAKQTEFSYTLARARHGVLGPRITPAHVVTHNSEGCENKCRALTRRGTPCQRKALANGRCPNHGGLSTGPKTAAGRRRIAAAQRRRWATWRQQRDETAA